MEPKFPFAEVRDAIIETGADTVTQCMQCGLCAASCPWRYVDGKIAKEFNARKVQHMAQLGVEGWESEDVIFACTTCGVCVDRCPRGVGAVKNIAAMRATLVEMGTVPRSLRPVLGSLHDNGNPWGGSTEKRMDWKKDIEVPTFTEDTEYLLYVCCTSCYDVRSQRIARSIATLLNKAGVSWGVIGTEEKCCGESAKKIGALEVFSELAEHNISLFQKHGVKKIITTSPHCLWTFQNEYPELGGEFEVVHYTQFLEKLLADGKLTMPESTLGKKVAFHDPCYLGRHSKVYDEPRTLLDAVPGLETVHFSREREDSFCCGGGGGRIWVEAEADDRFGDVRIADAKGQGADIVATTCPYCTIMLEASVMGAGLDEEMKVYDIAELLAGIE